MALSGHGQNKVTIPEGNCQLVIPGLFKSYLDTFETEIGPLVYHTYLMQDTSLSYQFTFCDYPYETMHSDSIGLLNEFFESTIDESVLSIKGTKKYESEISQFGYPGWFWRIDFGQNKFIKTKAFIAGRRFYTMQVFGHKSWDDQKKTFQFMDSFQFLNLQKVK